MRPSRGIHLIVPRDRIPIEIAVTLLSPDDGRPVFLIPHPEGILIGTTDHYHDGGLEDPRPTAAEVDYLLRAVALAFPDRGLTLRDVRGTFAGLRPILDTHADDPTEATREEDIWEEDGALSVAGGKLTTWRSTAESAVDEALKLLPERRASRAAPCATKGTPLAGLAPTDLADRLTSSLEVEPEVARAMARRLGSLAWYAAGGSSTPKRPPAARYRLRPVPRRGPGSPALGRRDPPRGPAAAPRSGRDVGPRPGGVDAAAVATHSAR